tara:strand:+ start:479 stop:640 length:162 start_codon:yes stop_codon:yes gene_type:complete
MIKKIAGKYVIYSESRDRAGKRKRLGSYGSKEAAEARLRQIERHKNRENKRWG